MNNEYQANIPPSSIDIEEAVLGAVMLERDAIEEIDFIKPECFYREAHQKIFEAVLQLYNKHEPIDIITVTNLLREKQELEEVGGSLYLVTLVNKIMSSANITYWATIIHNMFIRREMIRLSSETMKMAYSDETDISDAFAHQSKSIDAISELIVGNSNMDTIKVLLGKALDNMNTRIDNFKNRKPSGIGTGNFRLNKVTGGWKKGNLIVMASRPAMGKSYLSLVFAKSAALKGHKVLIFSLEMTSDEITDRLILSNTDLDGEKFRNGDLVETDLIQINSSIQQLIDANITIDQRSSVTPSYIRAKISQQVKKGCELVIIDYVQLINPESSKKNRTRENEVSEITRSLKTTAKESNVPIIALAQLSRKVEERASKYPELSDLRESASLEQDADLVLFPFRPGYYWEDEKMPQDYRYPDGKVKKNYGEISVAKNRHGRTGIVPFRHNDSMTTAYDWEDNWEDTLTQAQIINNNPNSFYEPF